MCAGTAVQVWSVNLGAVRRPLYLLMQPCHLIFHSMKSSQTWAHMGTLSTEKIPPQHMWTHTTPLVHTKSNLIVDCNVFFDRPIPKDIKNTRTFGRVLRSILNT